MNCLMGMSRKPVGEKLHFHVGIKTHFDVDIYIKIILIYNDKVQEGKVSVYKKIIIGFLSKITLFLEYLL